MFLPLALALSMLGAAAVLALIELVYVRVIDAKVPMAFRGLLCVEVAWVFPTAWLAQRVMGKLMTPSEATQANLTFLIVATMLRGTAAALFARWLAVRAGRRRLAVVTGVFLLPIAPLVWLTYSYGSR